jgi:hypothetical protein
VGTATVVRAEFLVGPTGEGVSACQTGSLIHAGKLAGRGQATNKRPVQKT